jgi:hypothetical protein
VTFPGTRDITSTASKSTNEPAQETEITATRYRRKGRGKKKKHKKLVEIENSA